MLDYEWDSNPSTLILSAHDDRTHDPPHDPNPDPTRPISFFDPTTHHSYNVNDHRLITSFSNQQFTIFSQTNQSFNNHHSFYDPRTTTNYQPPDSIYHPPSSSASVSATPPASAFFSFDQTGTPSAPASYYVVPKTEIDVSRPLDFTSNRIGLNLGGRTYFSAADDDFVSRLYRRSRPAGETGLGNSLSTPRCQAEGCNADLSHAKHYHRRHKVCEFHSKASTVVAAGLTQRFCQQCSRFHLLSEFDNGKRSCRKRLADHNRRRRKCHQSASVIHEIANKPSPKSPNESGVKSMSPPNVLLSPPTISLECFRQRQFQTTASSSTSASSSSNSMFFSSG